MKQAGIPTIEPLDQSERIAALSINILIGYVFYVISTGSFFPGGSGASIWFLALTAYWLLVLIAAPYFNPPKDVLGTAISVILMLVPLDFSTVSGYQTGIIALNVVTIIIAVLVIITSLIAIYYRNDKDLRIKELSYRLASTFGKGEILFTFAVMVSVFGFYQGDLPWMFAILGLWVFTITARPIELIIKLVKFFRKNQRPILLNKVSGTILRIDDPDLVRVSLTKDGFKDWAEQKIHVVHLPNGQSKYVLPIFEQIQNDEIIGTGLCCDLPESDIPSGVAGTVASISEDGLFQRVCTTMKLGDPDATIAGIIVEGSTIANIQFQVLKSIEIEEGTVVYLFVRGKKVYYQILDAKTKEESIQQNPFGIHVVSASQLGEFSIDDGFKKFAWLPSMNQPIFISTATSLLTQTVSANEFIIGKIPATSLEVPVNLDDLIYYHTAILGMTGTGKTELSLEIIENAIQKGAKVFCVDLTGEYKDRLKSAKPELIGLTLDQGSDLEKALFAIETGTYGAPAEKAALKGFLDGIKPQVEAQIDSFLESDEHFLGIFELTEITNTKATLRTTELYLSAIMDWARRNRKARQILIVLEEAHTIIPEGYGSGFDNETQWVVSRIGQIALQGRKYGVGLLLVSQRTALVSKTILSQCNTYFTHTLVDKTSLEYLSSVYSAEHVRVIPNLRPFEFLAHGKAVKSEKPVLLKKDFDKEKLNASRRLDKKVYASDSFAFKKDSSLPREREMKFLE